MKSLHYKLIVSAFALMGLYACSEDESPNSTINSSASNGGSSASIEDPTNPGDDTGESSASEDGASSASEDGDSSGSEEGNSSSSKISSSSKVSSSSVVLPAGTYEKLTTSNAKQGWGSRYWDGCKPHCAWREKIDTTANPFKIAKNCNINDEEIPAFTLSPNVSQYYTGYAGTKSSCDGGDAYTCTDMAPIAVNDTLAYAYAALPGAEASCGQCFQVQFDGGNHDNQIKEAHRLLKGKTLILMASNIGYDVAAGQFDILIPGGGVGNFDSFSKFLGVSKSDLGSGSGGFLTSCQQEIGDYDAPAAQFKTCVINKCKAVFGKDAKFANLMRGCQWFADWYQTADNPTFLYKKVECPAQLTNTYPSSINTTAKTTIKAGSF